MPSPAVEPLYVGVGSHVVAVDARSGLEIWRTELKGLGLGVITFPAGDAAAAAAAVAAA